MTEFKVKNDTYRAGKMVGLTQIHVLRRASPIIKPIFSSMGTGMTPEVAASVVEGLGNLADDKLEYILERTLSIVERKQDGERWAPIKSSDGRMFMFDDIRDSGMLILAICAHVLWHNYYPLFLEAPSIFSDGAAFRL